MERPSNLVVIESLKHEDICRRILGQKGALHVTNGTYMLPAEKIVAKQLGAFQLVKDRFAAEGDAFLIAVNSDASMKDIMEEKRVRAGLAVAESFDAQMIRAERVAVPVALQHPDRKIFVAFYDESTPTALYDLLKAKGADLATIYKWGYGLTPNGPGIEGQKNFRHTLGLPTIDGSSPVCKEVTKESRNDGVEIFQLQHERGKHGAPYMSPDDKVLFPVHAALAAYAGERPPQFAVMLGRELSVGAGNPAHGDLGFERLRERLEREGVELKPFPAESGLSETFLLAARPGAPALDAERGAALVKTLNSGVFAGVVKTAYKR